MSSKVEARRFSGKPGQWTHYAMAVKAHLAVEDLIEHLTDGSGLQGDKLAAWKKGQQKIYAYLILTCDDRAATTLESVDPSNADMGWRAFNTLADKYGDTKRAQLSKLVKCFFKRKQLAGESSSDYLNDMRAKLTQIEKFDAQKIWDVMKTTTVVQNLKDDAETKLTKKLISNRMAEAEIEGKTLSYDQIESIVENDQD